jgi:hypothetical protein
MTIKVLGIMTKGEKVRKRFVVQKPHHIWHADTKAKFKVRFVEGSEKYKQVPILKKN